MKRHGLLFFGCTLVMLCVVTVSAFLLTDRAATTDTLPATYLDGTAVETVSKPHELVLARTYLCGVRDEERIMLTQPLEQMLGAYNGWEIIAVEQGKVFLQKRENDIAPICKENGYFGLSRDGFLTLFNGVPGEQKVIQTFYQINTEKMEAALPNEEVELLRKGIRVHDLSEYNSVLSTYSEFQTEGTAAEGH